MRKEDIDYGFIDIEQINQNGEKHTSSFMWHKGSNCVDVLGNIPHGYQIVITTELIKKLSQVINYNPCSFIDAALNEGEGVYRP